MKNIKVLVLAVFLGTAASHSTAQSVVDSGSCGTNLTWKLTNDNILTISGSGAMDVYDLSSNYPPWNSYLNTIGTVVIDSGVTSIGDGAFYSGGNLTSATISNSITIIGRGAFMDCRRLSSVIIPSSVTYIGDAAFGGCLQLTSVTIPSSVTFIGHQAFGACRILSSIHVDSNNQRYSSINGILYNKLQDTLIFCPQFKGGAVIIPNTVTVIGNEAFAYCENLNSVAIPNSVIVIENRAFAYCDYLNTVTIPNSVTTIGNLAFFLCPRFTYIIIPNSVTSIGDGAFDLCYNATFVMCNATIPPALGKNVFYSTNIPIYIPCLTYDSYSTAFGWSNFTNFVINGNPTMDTTFYPAVKCYNVPYMDDNFTTPIDSSGIYCVTLVNSAGCDSVVCLILTENPYIPITNYSANICEGETYTDNNFTNLTETDIYYDTLQNSNGCDSIIELNLVVHLPSDLTQISDSVYVGNSYCFAGKLLTESGTYYDTLQNVNGCDSIIELTLTITGVGIVETHCNASLRIYPNPAGNQLTIDNGQFPIDNIKIYSVAGQMVGAYPCGRPQTTIDISHLANGIYFLRIQTKTNTIIDKIVKQ